MKTKTPTDIDPRLINLWRGSPHPGISGAADRILRLLAPVCTWRPRLRPPHASIGRWVDQPVFWRLLAGCVPSRSMFPETRTGSSPVSRITRITGVTVLTAQQYRELETRPGCLVDRGSRIWYDTDWSLLDWLSDARMEMVQGDSAVASWDRISMMTRGSDPGEEDVWDQFNDMSALAVHHAILDTPLVDLFREFLDLWIRGNFPVGFDDRGRLVVLVDGGRRSGYAVRR